MPLQVKNTISNIVDVIIIGIWLRSMLINSSLEFSISFIF